MQLSPCPEVRTLTYENVCYTMKLNDRIILQIQFFIVLTHLSPSHRLINQEISFNFGVLNANLDFDNSVANAVSK